MQTKHNTAFLKKQKKQNYERTSTRIEENRRELNEEEIKSLDNWRI